MWKYYLLSTSFTLVLIMKKISLIVLLLLIVANIFPKTIKVISSEDSGIGSLREAIANADTNDVITFANNITTIYFSGVIKLDKSITINGNEVNNTIIQNATTWTDNVNKKRYFEILSNVTVTLNHLTLKDNTANCGGGAIMNKGNLTLNNCTFNNNRAYDVGGAVYNSTEGVLIADNCIFSNNNAPSGAGALVCHGKSTSISNCTFEENSSQFGGAIYNNSQTSIKDCIFNKNGYNFGSAIYNTENGDIIVNNSIFRENKDDYRGTFRNSGNAKIINCLFINNYSIYNSGDVNHHAVIQNESTKVLTIINSSITDNIGMGIHNINGIVNLYNTILWNNKGIFGASNTLIKYDIYVTNGSITTANNLIGTSNTNLIGNNNIIGEDPLFVANGYSLQAGSPAIDAGSNSLLSADITKDLATNRRISNAVVDMGAYEYQNPDDPISAGINTTHNTNLKVYTQARNVVIENTTEVVNIYNTSGQCIARRAAARHGSTIAVPHAGLYMVRVGNEVRKAIVK